VNGVSIISASHYQAVAAIKSAGNNMKMVVVKATTAPPGDGQVQFLPFHFCCQFLLCCSYAAVVLWWASCLSICPSLCPSFCKMRE